MMHNGMDELTLTYLMRMMSAEEIEAAQAAGMLCVEPEETAERDDARAAGGIPVWD